MKREPVDFFLVRPAHEQIHCRLLNWARWARGGRGGNSTLPMFQNYRDGYHVPTGGGIPIDSLDATKIQKLFVGIPESNRWALHWTYLYPAIRVEKVCRVLCMTREALVESVHVGRSMVKNMACATG